LLWTKLAIFVEQKKRNPESLGFPRMPGCPAVCHAACELAYMYGVWYFTRLTRLCVKNLGSRALQYSYM
jgi:hypothetical protein